MDGQDRLTKMLCKLCKEMNSKQKSKIIYNAHSEESRKLANWWENHQLEDKRREEEEKRKADLDKLKKKALSKLTKKEIEILNIE